LLFCPPAGLGEAKPAASGGVEVAFLEAVGPGALVVLGREVVGA